MSEKGRVKSEFNREYNGYCTGKGPTNLICYGVFFNHKNEFGGTKQ